MTDSVDGELADDSQEGVHCVVRHARPRDVETQGKGNIAEIGFQCQADGRINGCFLKRLTAQVPQAVLEFGAARFQRSFGNVQVFGRPRRPSDDHDVVGRLDCDKQVFDLGEGVIRLGLCDD